jgi:hypothetical protein
MSLTRASVGGLRALKSTSNIAPAASKAAGGYGRVAAFSTQQKGGLKAADHAHEDHYDPPGGWLFGDRPGEKYQKEGWEGVWMWGFFGTLGLGVVAFAFKPDTS